jgi:membrane protein
VNLKRIVQFVTTDIWNISLEQFSKKKKIAITNLRIFSLALRGFKEDNCPLQASALTFYSLLSIVPVFAMFFSIAQGFGFEKILEKQLLEAFPAQKEAIIQIVDFAHSYLQNTKGGAIAFIGIIILIFTIIKVLSHVEKSFNSIWEIQKQRTIIRKFSDYLSIFLISPILILISSSITVYISSNITNLTETNIIFLLLGPILFTILKIFPYLLIWLLFSVVYMVMPNTNVKFKAAFYGAIIAGTLFQLLQWAFVTFQFGVTKYNAIYGSFSILPLFLIWLQLSWMIVLLGSEIAFATQNSERYEFEKETINISYYYYRFIAIGIMHSILQNFVHEKPALTSNEISHNLRIPIRLAHKIIHHLQSANLIHVALSENESKGYLPTLETKKYTIANVLHKLEHTGTEIPAVIQLDEFQMIRSSIDDLEKLIATSDCNKNLLAL